MADFVIVDENPLVNFTVLYGTGAIKFDPETRTVSRVGGINYTIKNGVVYDARGLLAEVRKMVAESKRRATSPDGQ